MFAFSLAKRTIRFLFLSKLAFISILKLMIDFDFFTDYLSPLLAPYASRRKIASKKEEGNSLLFLQSQNHLGNLKIHDERKGVHDCGD